MHCRCQSRYWSHQLHNRHSQPQRWKWGHAQLYSDLFRAWLFVFVFDMDLMQFKSIRCIWFDSHRVDPNSYAKVCFLTPMRSGTWRLAPSNSAFSLPSSPLVINWFFVLARTQVSVVPAPPKSLLSVWMGWFCYSFSIATFNWAGKSMMELG